MIWADDDPHADFADAWLDESEGHEPLRRTLPDRPRHVATMGEQRAFLFDPDEHGDAVRNGDL